MAQDGQSILCQPFGGSWAMACEPVCLVSEWAPRRVLVWLLSWNKIKYIRVLPWLGLCAEVWSFEHEMYISHRHNSFQRAAYCYSCTLTLVLDNKKGSWAKGGQSPFFLWLLTLLWLSLCYCSMRGCGRKKTERVTGCFEMVLPS